MSADMTQSQPRLLVLAGPEVMSAPTWPAMWRFAQCEFTVDPYVVAVKLAGDNQAFDALVMSSKGFNGVLLNLVRLLKRHRLGLPIYLMDNGGAPFRLEKILQLGILPLNILDEQVSTPAEAQKTTNKGGTTVPKGGEIGENEGVRRIKTEEKEGQKLDLEGVQAEKEVLASPVPLPPLPEFEPEEQLEGAPKLEPQDLEPLLTEAELAALLGTGR